MGGEKVVCTTFAAVIYLHKEVANSQRYMRGMERRNYMCSTIYFFQAGKNEVVSECVNQLKMVCRASQNRIIAGMKLKPKDRALEKFLPLHRE